MEARDGNSHGRQKDFFAAFLWTWTCNNPQAVSHQGQYFEECCLEAYCPSLRSGHHACFKAAPASSFSQIQSDPKRWIQPMHQPINPMQSTQAKPVGSINRNQSKSHQANQINPNQSIQIRSYQSKSKSIHIQSKPIQSNQPNTPINPNQSNRTNQNQRDQTTERLASGPEL